jgi:hypothetical protein
MDTRGLFCALLSQRTPAQPRKPQNAQEQKDPWPGELSNQNRSSGADGPLGELVIPLIA